MTNKENDNFDKKLVSAMKQRSFGQPNHLEIQRWKQHTRSAWYELDKSEWTRLAVACLVGFIVGGFFFSEPHLEKEQIEIVDDSATIERVYVNLE